MAICAGLSSVVFVADTRQAPSPDMTQRGCCNASSLQVCESAAEKVVILKNAGVMVAPTPSDMGLTVAALLTSR